MTNRLQDHPITLSPDFRIRFTLAALVLAAYANSFSAGFPLDNKALILQDTRVHEATRANVDLILNHTYWWPIGESGLYRPATTLSYLFNYAVLGNRDRPLGYHIVNLVLHIINVLLVYALLRRVAFRNRHPGWPFATAALWAVHPLSTEAVTNIVGRADLLAALSIVGGLLAYIKSTETMGAPRLRWLIVLALATTVGVFAKESAVVIVAVIGLYAICDRSAEADRSAKASRSIAKGTPRAPHAARGLPNGARGLSNGARGFSRAMLAIAPSLLLLWFQRSAVLGAAPAAEFPFVDNPIAGAGFWIGMLTAIAIMARYLFLIAWPMRLSADYSYAQIPLATGGVQDSIAWVAIALIVIGCVVLWRRDRIAWFFAGFALLTFLPAANLLFPTGTIMAERVMYLPSVGAIALIVIAVRSVAQGATFLSLLVLCLVVAALSVRTWIRNNDWRDELSLWTSTVKSSPQSFKAHRGLAETFYEADPSHANIDRVVTEIEQAIGVLDSLPDEQNDAKTFRMAGGYYLEQGDRLRGDNRDAPPPPAIRAYEKSVSALRRSATIIDSRKREAPAGPAADVYRVLSAAYGRLGQHGNAIDAAARARALEPFSVIGYQQSAAAFLSAQRGDDAAVTLMTGSLITNDRALRNELVDLYRQGLDPLGCAVVDTRDGPAINPSCATVRRHVCAATADAIQIHTRVGRVDQAQRLKDGAARQFHCP